MKASKWPFYWMEFLGIAGFVLTGALTNMFLENSASPVNRTFLVHEPFVRRMLVGIVLGIYITLASKAAGKLSGAHANPMMTWAYLRLQKITYSDALLYVIFQFGGAVAAVVLLKLTLPVPFGAHPLNYSHTAPQGSHTLADALIAEFIIAFIFVVVMLFSNSAKRLEKYVPGIAGLLICLFFVFEQPYSGMSINPARSFAGALGAGLWTELWIYFLAPLAGMLLATELFMISARQSQVVHNGLNPTGFWHTQNISTYPAEGN